MGLRQEFQKRIEKKKQEIRDLETRIRETNIYIQALEESMRLLPRESDENGASEQPLRAGTLLSSARDAIRRSAKPMHISEILKAIDKPVDKKNKLSLGGSLSGYVRRGEIFTRPAPNTFGLKEMQSESLANEEDLPDAFGKMA
jgi:hypothetical protein